MINLASRISGLGHACFVAGSLFLSLLVILSASLIRFNYGGRSRQLQLSPFVNRGGYIPARQRRKAVRRSTFDVELLD